jgi:hypothetical protein
VAFTACLGESANSIREPLSRRTRPPVSVNQILAFVARSSDRVPRVRKRLASM